MNDPDRLAEIDAREKAATKGPWRERENPMTRKLAEEWIEGTAFIPDSKDADLFRSLTLRRGLNMTMAKVVYQRCGPVYGTNEAPNSCFEPAAEIVAEPQTQCRATGAFQSSATKKCAKPLPPTNPAYCRKENPMTRKPAKGWYWGEWRSDGGGEPIRMLQREAPIGKPHPTYMACEAPNSCFEPAAEIVAEPDALKAGERVWVDYPKARVRGWAIIQPTKRETWFETPQIASARDKGFCYFCMEGSTSEWRILRAACHREGPQSEPPDEDAVFLGRYEVPDVGVRDFWWSKGCVCRHYNAGGGGAAGEWFNRFVPACIEQDGEGDGFVATNMRPVYRAALAVARELGLVEAEPERPEPKFQVGQCVKSFGGVEFRVAEIVWFPTRQMWSYAGQMEDGCSWSACEPNLEPCAPVLTAEQESLRPGDEVESIEIPVRPDGVPFGPDHEPPGRHKIKEISLREDGRDSAVLKNGGCYWLWNLQK